MTQSEALQKLSRLVDPAGAFAIPDHVLQDALEDRKRFTVHAVSTAYSVGERVISSPFNGRLYRCRVAGTSSSTAPDWPTKVRSYTIEDGDTLEWEDIGPTRNEQWDFTGAAYDVCMAMARMQAMQTDVTDNGVTIKRSQKLTNWMAIAAPFSLSAEIC